MVYAISGGLLARGWPAVRRHRSKETAMRVAQFSEFGGPEKLRIEEVPDPTPAEGRSSSASRRSGSTSSIRFSCATDIR